MNPSTGSKPPVPPGRGGLLNAKTSLGLLAAMLIGLVAMLGFLDVLTGGGGDAVPDTPVQGITPALESVDEGALAGLIPEEVRRSTERELRAWFSASDRKPIRDREAIDEEEWVAHLLASQVRVPVEGLPARIFGPLENIPSVIDEPGSHRGRLVGVWGRVDATHKIDVATGSGSREAVLVHLAADNGATWTVTCIGARTPDVGAWVKVHGVFTKLWPIDGGAPALHLFTTRPIVASFAPVAHASPDVEWLTMVDDADVKKSQELEERAFYGMLNYVRTLGPEGYRELRDTDAFTIADLTQPRAVQDQLVQRPANHRLQPVRIRAYPLKSKLAQDGDIPENSGNIEFVYRGFLVVDGPLPIYFYSPFPQATFDIADARLLEVEGFFFKRQWVTAGGKSYWMPVLIVTSMEKVATPEGGVSDATLAWALGIGALITLIALLVAIYRSRRAVNEFRARQQERNARRTSKAPA